MADRPQRPRASPRTVHEEQVLGHLRRSGRASRADLGLALGLSRSTVSGITAELVARGSVVPLRRSQAADGDGPQRVGRRPQMLALNPRAGLFAGVDLRYTRTSAVVVDAAHDVVASTSRACPSATSWDERLRHAAALVDELLRAGGTGCAARELRGLGVGLTGTAVSVPRVVTGSREALEHRFAVPVRLGNNARLAGLAEVVWGAARGTDDVLYVRFSTGVGGAVVLDGRMRAGTTDSAGEIGHVCLDPHGPPCRCGGRGCLESFTSLPRLLAAAGQPHLPALLDASDRGDVRAARVVADAGARIGLALAGAVTVLDVPRVVIGGELLELGEHLLDPVRKELARHLRAPSLAAVEVGAVALLLHDPAISLLATSRPKTLDRPTAGSSDPLSRGAPSTESPREEPGFALGARETADTRRPGS
ncbi:ROK family transcriptional regulator [Pseudokineococcus basanitobsidens]|uniref:ROK family transcriptional regulator n=1 Tax=Pseudokineococcus basanitobsidens TaxID=1926649 RepID=A0ABU8RF91_9ACTN